MQYDPKHRDEMTYPSPTTGDRVGLSFIMPRTRRSSKRAPRDDAELGARHLRHDGPFARFHERDLRGLGRRGRLLRREAPEFADNMRRYYEYIRENDVMLTHSLINLQRSRNVSGMFNLQEGTALAGGARDRAGIVVRGARILATLGPLSDEIAVYSPRLARHSDDHSPFALNFAIPCGTPGLRFLCRDSFDLGRSHFDHPLGSRFEEMDCIVFFDDVLVPWERVFSAGDVDRLNRRRTSPTRRRIRRIRARPRTSPNASSCSASRC